MSPTDRLVSLKFQQLISFCLIRLNGNSILDQQYTITIKDVC